MKKKNIEKYLVLKCTTSEEFLEILAKVMDYNPTILDDNPLEIGRNEQIEKQKIDNLASARERQIAKYRYVNNSNKVNYDIVKVENPRINKNDASTLQGTFYMIKVSNYTLIRTAINTIIKDTLPKDKVITAFWNYGKGDKYYNVTLFKDKKDIEKYVNTLPTHITKHDVILRNGDKVLIEC